MGCGLKALQNAQPSEVIEMYRGLNCGFDHIMPDASIGKAFPIWQLTSCTTYYPLAEAFADENPNGSHRGEAGEAFAAAGDGNPADLHDRTIMTIKSSKSVAISDWSDVPSQQERII